MTQPNTVDLDLIEKIVAHVPEWTWSVVRDALVANIVDQMPGSVVEKLTGDYDNFDRAEEILLDYYNFPDRNQDLIVDAFKILGAESTVYILDSLQLDKVVNDQDNSPCSVEQ